MNRRCFCPQNIVCSCHRGEPRRQRRFDEEHRPDDGYFARWIARIIAFADFTAVFLLKAILTILDSALAFDWFAGAGDIFQGLRLGE